MKTPLSLLIVLGSWTTVLVRRFLDCGLRLNDVYEVKVAFGGLVSGHCTLLDYAHSVRAYVSPKRKKLKALANKHAGGLGGRRRFIDETIALLEAHGAKRAADLSGS